VSSVTDLPTARDYLRSNVRLVIWCKACRHQREIGFQSILDQGKGRAVQRSIHDAHGEDRTDAAEGDAMPTI
jgi:hypothetical protein